MDDEFQHRRQGELAHDKGEEAYKKLEVLGRYKQRYLPPCKRARMFQGKESKPDVPDLPRLTIDDARAARCRFENDPEIAPILKMIREPIRNLPPVPKNLTLDGLLERFRDVVEGGNVSKEVQVMAEELFALRERNFQGAPQVPLLVEEKDQITHKFPLDNEMSDEELLELLQGYPYYFRDRKRRLARDRW